MLLPSSYFDMNLTNNQRNLISSANSKMPFGKNNTKTKRDKHMVFANLNPTSPSQALAMMDYDLGNELLLNNTNNAYYKSKIVNGDRRR
jgi:hypothetical protein